MTRDEVSGASSWSTVARSTPIASSITIQRVPSGASPTSTTLITFGWRTLPPSSASRSKRLTSVLSSVRSAWSTLTANGRPNLMWEAR